MTRAILTCSPHFVSLALNEIRRCFPETTVLQNLAPGYILLQTPGTFDKLSQPWRHRLPIYLHHLFPVHEVVLLNALEPLPQLQEITQRFAQPAMIVQVRSADEIDFPCSVWEIQQALNSERSGQKTPGGRVLSILIARSEVGFQAYFGISWASQNLSPWPGGQMPITEPVSNRAGYKLLEALQTFDIRLRRGDQALDLGAAPGAWTTLLRRRNLRVTAVAPTPLYPWLLYDAGVSYQPLRAEDFLSRCQTTYDLIVNDMKKDAQDSARLMVEYAGYLRSEGIAIMTLKLHSINQERRMDHTFRILRKAYKIIRVRQLVSNRKEVTLFLRRKT